ncbi:MAG TPA: hypothetical protein VLK79_06985 [Gaiellales bacterium]|nr:hypothetical protein [Gaiellales bacterium]
MWARIDRLARPPSGLAALALGLGVVNIVSALTPELTERRGVPCWRGWRRPCCWCRLGMVWTRSGSCTWECWR